MSKLVYKDLGELAAQGRSVISGPFGSNIGKRFFQKEGIPVIRGNNLTTDFNKFVDEGFVFLTEDKADELKADAIKGDILFTAAGTIGQVGMIPDTAKYKRYVISNKQLRLRVDLEKADPEYVYYWLSSPWIYNTIVNRNTGSTVPLINLGIIKSLPISIPEDISEQKSISRIFSTIDKKIELNKRINDELEAMTKALYDFWFVQFDFPDANGKPYKTAGGKMVYNPSLKREIPDGWEIKKLSSKLSIGSGFPFDSTKYIGFGTYKVITIKNVQDDGLKTDKTDFVDLPPQGLQDFCKLQVGDVLISLTGNVGRLCLVNENNLLLNQRVGKFLCGKSWLVYFYLYFLRAESKLRLENISTGSSQKNLSPVDAVNFYHAFPPDDVISKFNNLTRNTIDLMVQNSAQNQILIQMRDWLLPMLMNGQVTVK